MKLTGQFEIAQWDENPNFETEDGQKMSLAVIKQTYSGDLCGESVVNYSMCYLSSALAYFTGFERLSLQLGEKSGVILISHEGQFADGQAQSDFTVIANAGTGDFSGVVGQGKFVANLSGVAEYEIELEV